MSVAVAAPTRSVVFQDHYDLVRAQVDTLLEHLSPSGLEARRQITRELHIEPRPEELQTIVRLAEDSATEGLRYELPRQLLTLRVLALREERQLYEMTPLQPERIEKAVRLFPDLLAAARELEAQLGEAVGSESPLIMDDRDFIVRAGRVLSCNREQLVANSTLVARLAELARAVVEGDLDTRTESLAEEDRLALAAAITGDSEQRYARPTIDALAMRSSVDNLLAEWRAMGPPSGDTESQRQLRESILEKMRQTRICFEQLADRLQVAQDEALVAGAQALADEFRAAGRGLFSAKLRLAKLLREPFADEVVEDLGGEEIESIQEMLGGSLLADANSEAAPKQQTEEEVYLGALKEMRDKKLKQLEERPDEIAERLKRERRRMRLMIASAVVLAITSAVVNFMILPSAPSEPVAPPVTDFSRDTNAERVETAGPIVFTHVDGWNKLSESEKRSQVETMAGHMGGFDGMFIIDEYGEVGAAWSPEKGVGVDSETP